MKENSKPVPEERAKKVRELRNDIKSVGRAGKTAFEKEWYRNILFYIGRQWIRYDELKREWSTDTGLEKWFPKPVTNKFASAANTIKSVLTQKEPRVLVRPATQSEEDVATAEIGDSLVDVLTVESGFAKARKTASAWNILTGNFFFHSYYYVDKELGEVFIPYEICNGCNKILPPDKIEAGACPSCGGKDIAPAIGQDGSPQGITLPKGKLSTDCVSPFEMFFNQQVTDFKKVREVVRSKRIRKALAVSMFPVLKDKSIVTTGTEHAGDTMQKALAFITSSSGEHATGDGSSGGDADEMVTIDYLFSLPSGKFPKGVMSTLVNDEVVEDGDFTVKNREGVCFIPIVHGGCNGVPGRVWFKTLVDDLVHKQLQRNRFESLIELIAMTMGSPQWLIPDGSEADVPTGQPGQKIRYKNQVGSVGGAPTKASGSEVPMSLFKILEKIDKDMEDLSKSYDVLRGNSPSSNIPYASLRLLNERAFSAHNDMVTNWEEANAEVFRQQIEIAREHFDEDRKRTIQNENGSWETETFNRADLQGGVDIKVEAGSTMPKSQVAEQAAILDSVARNLVDVTDPAVKYKVLEALGQAHLAKDIDSDSKDAMREWKAYLESVKANQENPQAWVTRPRYGVDNDIIHLRDAVARAKSEEFFQLPQQSQVLWIEHISYHKTKVDAQMMQSQMQDAAPKQGGTKLLPQISKDEPPPARL